VKTIKSRKRRIHRCFRPLVQTNIFASTFGWGICFTYIASTRNNISRRTFRRCVYLSDRGNNLFLILARRKEKSGSRKIASVKIGKIPRRGRYLEMERRSIWHVRANLSRVCHANRNCIIISETRNRDREFRVKNLNFQISSALCIVGKIFYDYRELLYIQRSVYFKQ